LENVSKVNAAFRAGVARWPNAHLLDWRALAGSHAE
jgi:hypothetical protein